MDVASLDSSISGCHRAKRINIGTTVMKPDLLAVMRCLPQARCTTPKAGVAQKNRCLRV